MQPSDLTRIRLLSSPTVHPECRDVVLAMSRPDAEENRYRSSLWRQRLSADGATDGELERFTHSTRDSSPAYSPDGSRLAFLRASEDGPAQLHVIANEGGDARLLTDTKLGVVAFAWSPDGGQIAYAARVPEEGRYGTDESVKPDQEAPRLIEHSTYLADGLGYVLDRPSKIFLVDLDELPAPDAEDADELPESRQLTSGEGDDRQPAFLDGGQRVGFIASRDERGAWRPDTLISDLCSVDLRGKGFRRHTSGTGSVSSVHVAADGAVVYGANDLGPGGQDFVARNTVLHRLPTTGTAQEGHGLTDPEEDHLACAPALGAGGTLVAAFEHRGDTVIRDVDTGATLLDGNVSVSALAVGGGVVVAVAGTRTSYSELFVGRVGERLTQVGDLAAPHLTGTAAPIEPEELETSAEDGYPVHGWLFRPTTKASRKGGHPVVLMIHGGPYTQYSGNLFDEAQVLAGAGYAVVMGNPRGGSGYGATHGRAVKEAIGTVDVADLMALLDHALTLPELDGSRVGVQGGSYGGLMTTWLVAHSDRFTAAISERAVNAWDSFAGTSDIGWFFGDEYVGELAQEQSPLTWADQIRTPTLVMHSERDFRCPLEQGQRLYARLRRNGVPTKLLVFPGEGHELSRAGQPRHRVQRFEHILDWWAEYLR
ncbi:alpha/beta hydrolase family protein [Ornithinimicrobium pratense]|uniref:S9 family peptidase n=1 Tax=Ornithinimicrobium pratense TaxID=2593973 RepID=A0A5J6V7N6_9MICO|nr:S9 family peptidase [Ornithinimicrobium pratense]QFG69093.1 S9 family peptidase [Ornithinimicrobium pratense]